MLNHREFRAAARRRLPKGVFEYIDRGSEDETGLALAREAWERHRLVPSVLVDVSERSLTIDLFGRPAASPIVVAPTALAGLVWHDGEVALARAAAAAGVPFCVATQSSTPIERIATSGARLWLQLYVWRDRALTYRFLERARAAGAEALLLTVDTVVPPNREYNVHNGFGVPLRPSFAVLRDVSVRPRWLLSVLLRQLLTAGIPTYAHYPAGFRTRIGRIAVADAVRLDDRVDWNDVRELRRRWPGPLILKGILSRADALKAVEAGCDGIVVSSHGARNLDSAIAAADALAPIADAVAGRLTVLADSGIRRGSDVVKALALGAKAVLVGRLPLFGVAADGERGAKAALDMLAEELSRTMAFIGRTRIADIDRSLLAGAPPADIRHEGPDDDRFTVR
jgi:L-lactate dehydrogenase (cytochrome)